MFPVFHKTLYRIYIDNGYWFLIIYIVLLISMILIINVLSNSYIAKCFLSRNIYNEQLNQERSSLDKSKSNVHYIEFYFRFNNPFSIFIQYL